VFAGLHRERDREMAFAGAGRAEEADVGVLLDPGQLRQVGDERALGGRLGLPVEVLERLAGRELRRADALAGARGVTCEHLGLEQRLEELLVGPLLGTGPLCGLLEALEHARRLQLCEQVGQPLADGGPLRLGAHAQSAA
jgi:hypothetical protein